jgi:hypothetical protein
MKGDRQTTMTNNLKELLKYYGTLTMTLDQLLRERPGTQFGSLEEYYKELGVPRPDEPVLVVRISKNGEARFLKEGEHCLQLKNENGGKVGVITVCEMPEDEYWFFQAFRQSLFDLQRNLPSFIYEMAIVHSYAMFEAYLSDLLRARFQIQPLLMGGQRQVKYEQIFEAISKADLINAMIEREVRELMYLPFNSLVQKMRDKLGFTTLSDKYTDSVNCLALVRNCLMHNSGRVDAKLASAKPNLHENAKLSITMVDVSNAVNVLRKFAYEVDKSFEKIT